MIKTIKIKGKKGKNLIYSVNNFQFDDINLQIKWDPSKFYTPIGNQVDTEGNKYFDVPAGEINLKRDDTIDKEIYIIFIFTGIQFEVIPLEFFVGNGGFREIFLATEKIEEKNSFGVAGNWDVLEVAKKLKIPATIGEKQYELVDLDQVSGMLTVEPAVENLQIDQEIVVSGPISIGIEGDIIIDGYIPCDSKEINFTIKEVLDGECINCWK